MMLSSRFLLKILPQAVSSLHAIIQVHALTHKLGHCWWSIIRTFAAYSIQTEVYQKGAPPPRLHVTSLYCSKVGDLSLKCCHPSLQASSSSYHRRLKISILQCIHRLDLQSSRCFSSRHSSRDAPRVIPPSDAPPVVTAEVDPRGCAPPHCSKKIDELSLEYLRPSLWASSSSEELNNDMYSSFGTTYNRHLQSTLDLYLLQATCVQPHTLQTNHSYTSQYLLFK